MTARTVYFVSDGTGITAETFGNSILAQFSIKPRHVRRPFIDTAEKAQAVVAEINELAVREGERPIVFATLVDRDVLKIVREHCQGRVMDMFGDFDQDGRKEFRTILFFQTGEGDATSLDRVPAVYALDVTDPTNPIVLWEYSMSSVTAPIRAAFMPAFCAASTSS